MMQRANYQLVSYTHPSEFPADVLGLFTTAESTDIEFGPAWLANLIDTVFTDQSKVRIYVLLRDAKPVIGLPLLIARKMLGEELQSLSNFYTSLFSPATAPDVAVSDYSALLKSIHSLHPALYAFRLEPLDAESSNVQMLKSALEHAGYKCIDYFRFFNWYEQVNGDWEKYLSERAGQVRSTLKRKLAKLQKDEGSLQIVQAGAELEEAIKDYVSVYSDSWKRPEPFVNFIPGLLRTAAARGWLRMGMVRLQGQAVAAQIWLIHEGRASIFKLAYRESHKSYSPGSLLTAHLMRAAMENDNVKIVDYLTGDDAYKREWMSSQRSRMGIIALNKKHPAGVFSILRHWLADQTRPIRGKFRRILPAVKTGTQA